MVLRKTINTNIFVYGFLPIEGNMAPLVLGTQNPVHESISVGTVA